MKASEARDLFGSAKKMAEMTGLSFGGVTSWARRGDLVPKKHRGTVIRAATEHLCQQSKLISGWLDEER